MTIASFSLFNFYKVNLNNQTCIKFYRCPNLSKNKYKTFLTGISLLWQKSLQAELSLCNFWQKTTVVQHLYLRIPSPVVLFTSQLF